MRDCPLAETVAAESRPVEIDLKPQTIVCNNNRFIFVIDPINRNQLHKDCHNFDLTKSYRNEITAFRGEDRNGRPGAPLESTRNPKMTDIKLDRPLAAVTVVIVLISALKFPANREINRELHRMNRFDAILNATREQIENLARKFHAQKNRE